MKSYGAIKMYNAEKGFGFIRLDSNGNDRPKDIFFHISDFHTADFKEPAQGLRVEFEVADGRDKNGETKPRARFVTPEDSPVAYEAMAVRANPRPGASRY